MQRREFMAGLGGATGWPLAARAQQPERVRRVGILLNASANDPEFQAWAQPGAKLLPMCSLALLIAVGVSSNQLIQKDIHLRLEQATEHGEGKGAP